LAIPPTHRVARAIVKALDQPNCVDSLAAWSEAAAAAPSTLRMWCAAIDIRPRDVLGFIIALWVIRTARKLGVSPGDLLPFAEKRTRKRFLQRSGPLGSPAEVVSVSDFYARQTLLTHRYVVEEVERLSSGAPE
jgi:hypothetical protein